MPKSRLSRNLLVCAAIMGVFQSGILLAATQFRPESGLRAASVQTIQYQSSHSEPFFH